MANGLLSKSEVVHTRFTDCLGEIPLDPGKRWRLENSLSDYDNFLKELQNVVEAYGTSLQKDQIIEMVRSRGEYRDYITDSPYPTSIALFMKPKEAHLYTAMRSGLRRFQLDLAETPFRR